MSAENPDSVKLRWLADKIDPDNHLADLPDDWTTAKVLREIADRLDALWGQVCSDPWECCIPEHNRDPRATELGSRAAPAFLPPQDMTPPMRPGETVTFPAEAPSGHYMLLTDNGDGTTTFVIDGEPLGVMPGGLDELAAATATLFPEAIQHIEAQAILIEGGPDGR